MDYFKNLPRLNSLITEVLLERHLELKKLLVSDWKEKSSKDNPLKGFCYLAAEAFYFLGGGKENGLKPRVIRFPNGESHWWIEDRDKKVYDPTATQFKKPIDYSKGRSVGFPNPTKKPSLRTTIFIKIIEGYSCHKNLV